MFRGCPFNLSTLKTWPSSPKPQRQLLNSCCRDLRYMLHLINEKIHYQKLIGIPSATFQKQENSATIWYHTSLNKSANKARLIANCGGFWTTMDGMQNGSSSIVFPLKSSHTLWRSRRTFRSRQQASYYNDALLCSYSSIAVGTFSSMSINHKHYSPYEWSTK